MVDTKAEKRIKSKNKRRRSREPEKVAPEGTEAPEGAPEEPVTAGPEPQGMKERVKKGFLTERDALRLLVESPMTASPKIIGWLRRRL